MTITSGMNAIAHAVEALYSPESNPMIDMLAEQGIAAIARALPIIHKDPLNKDARSDALFGAWACGTCLGAVGMSLHHKLCHTLGGSFNVLSRNDFHCSVQWISVRLLENFGLNLYPYLIRAWFLQGDCSLFPSHFFVPPLLLSVPLLFINT